MTGKTIGQYEIREQLGSGGMGVVYRALDTKLDRDVALKFLPPHMSADASAKARFIQEAKAASALDHANICTIHDIAEDDDGQLFIVMTFYEGDTLKYRLQQGALPLAEAVDIGIQLSRGLARAHEAGIVHRDIKPANIMVTRRNEVKILDFGVAKLSQSADLTKAGSTVGTAAYMSPEQSKGEPVDVRSDVWSVGVVLYEMLTGKQPFEGGYEAAMTYAIVNETPTSPHDIDAAIPPTISDIVMRCLAKKPEERFADAAHVATRLDEFKSPSGTHQTSTARAASVPESGEKPASDIIPSSSVIALRFAMVAAGTIAGLYGLMMVFGWPDWVLPLGIILMMMGLPALLVSANQDRRKAEGHDIGGPFEWLTYRRAVKGGFISMGSLVLLTVIFMGMRSAGIGPAGSLQASGALETDAKIVVAEFENKTDEAGLSSSISELLRIALSQSNVVQVMDGADIVAVLGRMNRSSDDVIDLNTAMEIAAREGAEAVLYGEISPIGAGFFISARLLAAHDGSELVALSQTARSDNDVIDAVDQLTQDLRERIGESIRTIRSNSDLDRVTTSSLDALRLYTQGVKAEEAGEFRRSIELLRQAIERDPEFAMAYRKLAVTYNNASFGYDQEVEAATKAYELRERLPERERFLAIAYYHAAVTNDPARADAAYESLLELDPTHTSALNNLSLSYQRQDRWDEAIALLERALVQGTRSVYYQNLIASLAGAGRLDDAWEMTNKFEEVHPGHPQIPAIRMNLLTLQGRIKEAGAYLSTSERATSPGWLSYDHFQRRRYAEMQGKLRSALDDGRQEARYKLAADDPAGALNTYIAMSLDRGVVQGDRDAARQILAEGLQSVPLDSIPAYTRPYSVLAFTYFKLGDVDEGERVLSEYESVVPENIRRGDIFRHSAFAQRARARGDLARAVQIIRDGQVMDECASCNTITEAEILAEMDSLTQALDRYEYIQDWSWGYAIDAFGQLKAPMWLEMGELYSRTGQTEEAIEAYSNFVDMWAEADPELQPKVRYARERIERLLEQSVREPQ